MFPSTSIRTVQQSLWLNDFELRLLQKETFNIDENDALDFLHATVPIAYGDFVLLDKHWADLARKLKFPSDCVKVYSPNRVEQFLEDLEQFQGATLTVN